MNSPARVNVGARFRKHWPSWAFASLLMVTAAVLVVRAMLAPAVDEPVQSAAGPAPSQQPSAAPAADCEPVSAKVDRLQTGDAVLVGVVSVQQGFDPQILVDQPVRSGQRVVSGALSGDAVTRALGLVPGRTGNLLDDSPGGSKALAIYRGISPPPAGDVLVYSAVHPTQGAILVGCRDASESALLAVDGWTRPESGIVACRASAAQADPIARRVVESYCRRA